MKKLICGVSALSIMLCGLSLAGELEEGIVGPYLDAASASMYMSIAEGEAKRLNVEIHLPSDDGATETVWNFNVLPEADSSTLPYSDCAKTCFDYATDSDESTRILYENGTGILTIDGETHDIIWQDDVEDAGSGRRFVFGANELHPVLEGLQLGDSAEDIENNMGQPDAVVNRDDARTLIYRNYELLGVNFELRLILRDNRLIAADLAGADCDDDDCSTVTEWIMDRPLSTIADLSEESIIRYTKAYTGIEDTSTLVYFARNCAFDELMLYIRSAQTRVDVLYLAPQARLEETPD